MHIDNYFLTAILIFVFVGICLLFTEFFNMIRDIFKKCDDDFYNQFANSHPTFYKFKQDWYRFNKIEGDIVKKIQDTECKINYYIERLKYYIPSYMDIPYDNNYDGVNSIVEFINSLPKEQFANLSLSCLELNNDNDDNKDFLLKSIEHSKMKYDVIERKISMYKVELAGLEALQQSLKQTRIDYLKNNFNNVLDELNHDLHKYKRKYAKEILCQIKYWQSVYDDYVN